MDTKFHTGKVFTISSGHFVHDVFSSFLAPFLPLLIAKFNISMVLAGALTVYFRIPSLFNPFIGSLSDRFDMKYWAIFAPTVTACAMSMLGVLPNYFMIALMILISGIASSVFHVMGPVMIARAAGNKIGLGMSFWMTAGELARTFGPLLAVSVISLLSFEGSYPVMGLGFLFSIFFYIALKDTELSVAKKTSGTLKQTWKELKHIFIPLSGVIISRSFMVGSLGAFLPTYMVNAGKSLWIGGASLAVLELFGTLGTFMGGTISDRIGRKTVLFIAVPVSCLLMLGFTYSPDWLEFPMLIILGCTLFAITPVNLAIVQDVSGKQRGKANGIFMGINFLATAAVTFLVGGIADLYSLKVAFTISSLVGLLGIPVIFFIPIQNIKK